MRVGHFFIRTPPSGPGSSFETTKAKQLVDTGSVSVSGPIKKDRAWFFASVNILKVPSKQFYQQTVPTNLMRQGNFSELLTLQKPVTVIDPTTGVAFPGNIIPQNRLNALSQKVNADYLPLPPAMDWRTISGSPFRSHRLLFAQRLHAARGLPGHQ